MTLPIMRWPLICLLLAACAPLTTGNSIDLQSLAQWVTREGETHHPATGRPFVIPAQLANALGLGTEEVVLRQKAVVSAEDREIVNVLQVAQNERGDILVSRRERLGGRWTFWRATHDHRIIAIAVLQPDGTVYVPAGRNDAAYDAAITAIGDAYAGRAPDFR